VFIALHFTHTVVPKTLTTWAFWVFLAIHLGCCALYAAGFLHADFLRLNPDDMQVIVAITVFFEVFYTRQCYQRFERLWSLTNTSFTFAYDIAFAMRLFIQKSGRPYDRVAFRWVVVTLLLSLIEARKKHSVTRKDLELMVDLGLVRPPEVAFLQDVTGHQRMLIMLHAAANIGRVGGDKAGAPPDAPKNFCTALMNFRAAQQEMQDLLRFPVPFGYVHLLSLMICLCLAASAYGMAITGSIFAPFFYSLTSVVFIGMMDLANRLSDPLGEDESDFPLSKWIQTFLSNVASLIDYEHDGALDDFQQEIEDEERAPSSFLLAPAVVEDMLGTSQGEE
jgi:hypothetical protein